MTIQAKVLLRYTSPDKADEVWLNFGALPREGEIIRYKRERHVVVHVDHVQHGGDDSTATIPHLYTLVQG